MLTPEARARAIIDHLAREEFVAAVGQLDPTMTAALPAEKLAAVWKSIVASVGPLQEHGDARVSQAGAHAVVVIPCRFEHAPLDVKIALDAAGLVAGLFFLPPEAVWTPPPYAAEDAVAREITFGADPWILPGTLTLPADESKGPFPAIVLVHGSGPGDRDETVGQNKPFKDLALGLAAHGIAVLRFDKRTRVHAAKLAQAMSFTVNDESVDDAIAAAALLRATPGIDPARVFVLGHSLGGQLVPRVAARDPSIAGIIVLAGSTRPIGDMMVEQLRYIASLPGGASAVMDAQIQAAELAAARVRAIEGGAEPMPGESILGAPASYWLDLKGYDAPALAATLPTPILVLQGGRDYQVTEVDFEAWKRALGASGRATLKLYSGLNHLFAAGEGKSVPAEYLRPAHVDEEVVRDLAAWVKRAR